MSATQVVGLKLALHLEAAYKAPREWLIAVWWRLLGKRLRARIRFARLMGASQRAYQLWLLNEPALPCDGNENAPPIIALVAAGERQDETVRSVYAQGGLALALGTPEIPGPADAAKRIDWHVRPWLMPIAAGDKLAPEAIAAYGRAAASAPGSIVYADDDLLDTSGKRIAPHFKPKWNAELFRYFDYLTGACIVRAEAGELSALSGADWASRLVASHASSADNPAIPLHLPHVLHHRRSRPAPRIPVKVAGGGPLEKVTVIVPTRNRVDLLRTCLDGLKRTEYPEMEVVVVDNGSDDLATLDYLASLDTDRFRILRAPGPFNFSRLNNRAVSLASGSLLCLLNNDIEVLAPDWLSIMARQALRPEVGAVGARLLYPDGRIQHAGVVLGVGGGAAHAHRLLPPDTEGYFQRHSLPQFVSAVTGACLVVRRACFEAVGGFDEQSFPVAFNDVDLCMRMGARGWQSLYEPRATLIHHESVSRGLDRDREGAARLAGELAALQMRWGTREGVDPFHHPRLNRSSERFVLQI